MKRQMSKCKMIVCGNWFIQLHKTIAAISTTTTKLCTENEKYKNQEDIDNNVKHWKSGSVNTWHFLFLWSCFYVLFLLDKSVLNL